jgi:hypothetical protein
VPASRSRTERWRQCLRQVHERDGALEVSIPIAQAPGSAPGEPGHADLIWRVRILTLTEDDITVEQPSAAGRWMALTPGVRLIAVMSIGQNRWMFHTAVQAVGANGLQRTMRLAMPTMVERCQRRNFYRISTAELSLPRVECWPLLDPQSVIPAEIANRAQVLGMSDVGCRMSDVGAGTASDEPLLLPEVGPKFLARLMNLGGGGVGLIIDPKEAGSAERSRLLWLRIDLTPTIPAPLAMTARPVHTHLDSSQSVYAGLSFEWAFHPAHREFVVEQIGRYVESLQRCQRLAPVPA